MGPKRRFLGYVQCKTHLQLIKKSPCFNYDIDNIKIETSQKNLTAISRNKYARNISNKMSATTITATEFNGRNVTVSAPKAVEVEVNGKRQSVGKKAFVNYNGERLRLQSASEMKVPFGLSIYTAEGGGQAKHSINLSFNGYQQEGEVKSFYDAVSSLDAAVIDQAVANSKAWFGKQLSREVIQAFYTPSIKFGNDSSKNYPPTIKLNLRRNGDAYETKFYDLTGKPYRGIPVDEMLGKGALVTALIEASDIWIAGSGKFNIRWNVSQIIVHKVPSSGAEFAFKLPGVSAMNSAAAMEETETNQVDDDEEEAATARPSVLAAVLPQATPQPSQQSQEEDDEEEAEAPPPPPQPKVTKKKPVVIAKKA
jgi:Family of unknown function (DUF5871)